MESANLTDMNIDKIAALFPNCITETADENGKLKKAINFEMLRAMLSKYIAEGDEAYEFTWVGKKAAIAEANRPIRKTLRPCVEESVNWDSTENLYIEGDNLEVLKLLQESYLGKVKMIYIDPPYNTGNDFIYRDDFAISSDDYAEESGQLDDEGNRLFKNTDSNGRFHSDWCSMIYSRLMLARNLLADDGVIFISIDDNEVGNLRKICDDIYGGESFIAEFPRITKKGGKSTNTYAKNHDYVLAFCKNANAVNIKGIEHNDDGFKFTDEFAPERGPYKLNQTLDYNTLGYINSLDYPITIENTTFFPGGVSETEYLKRKNDNPKDGYRWRWSKEKFDFGYKNGWIVVSNSGRIYTKTYLNASIEKDSNGNYYIVYNRRTKPISTLEITDNSYSNDNSAKEIQDVLGKSIFDYVKPTSMINLFMRTVTDYDSIILDFFSGSATTAHAVMQLNAADGGHRKFIMVQLPEETDKDSEAYRAGYKNICEIGKERIRRAGAKIKSETGADIDYGFRVLKLDDSNMKDVYYSPSEMQQQMLGGLESNIKPDRSDLDLLFGCLLDWGLPLTMPYSIEEKDGCCIHIYNDGDLVACFNEEVPESVIKYIADKNPLRVLFRDSCFKNSPEKINVAEIFKQKSPDTRIKII